MTGMNKENDDVIAIPHSSISRSVSGIEKHLFDIVVNAHGIPTVGGTITLLAVPETEAILGKKIKNDDVKSFIDVLLCKQHGVSREGGRIRKSIGLFEEGTPGMIVIESAQIDRKMENTGVLEKAIYSALYSLVTQERFDRCMPFIVWDNKKAFKSDGITKNGRNTSRRIHLNKDFRARMGVEKILGTQSLMACGRLPKLLLENINLPTPQMQLVIPEKQTNHDLPNFG